MPGYCYFILVCLITSQREALHSPRLQQQLVAVVDLKDVHVHTHLFPKPEQMNKWGFRPPLYTYRLHHCRMVRWAQGWYSAP